MVVVSSSSSLFRGGYVDGSRWERIGGGRILQRIGRAPAEYPTAASGPAVVEEGEEDGAYHRLDAGVSSVSRVRRIVGVGDSLDGDFSTPTVSKIRCSSRSSDLPRLSSSLSSGRSMSLFPNPTSVSASDDDYRRLSTERTGAPVSQTEVGEGWGGQVWRRSVHMTVPETDVNVAHLLLVQTDRSPTPRPHPFLHRRHSGGS